MLINYILKYTKFNNEIHLQFISQFILEQYL